jgi:hypothetical protein
VHNVQLCFRDLKMRSEWSGFNSFQRFRWFKTHFYIKIFETRIGEISTSSLWIRSLFWNSYSLWNLSSLIFQKVFTSEQISASRSFSPFQILLHCLVW